jgi:hypothetical protein
MRTSDFYNFCRVHESLRVTPGMALGVTNQRTMISFELRNG